MMPHCAPPKGSLGGQAGYTPDFHPGSTGLNPAWDNLPQIKSKLPSVPYMTTQCKAYFKMLFKKTSPLNLLDCKKKHSNHPHIPTYLKLVYSN